MPDDSRATRLFIDPESEDVRHVWRPTSAVPDGEPVQVTESRPHPGHASESVPNEQFALERMCDGTVEIDTEENDVIARVEKATPQTVAVSTDICRECGIQTPLE